MTPSGSAIWLAIAVLVAAGFCDRSLRRLRIRCAQAVLLALGIGLGSFFNLAGLNVGGGIIASIWGLWLLSRGSAGGALHALEACSVGGAVLFTLTPGPWTWSFAAISPLIVGALATTAIHLLARDAREALAATLLASPIAGFAALTLLRVGAIPGVVSVGGGAFYDAQAVAVVLAGALAAVSARYQMDQSYTSVEPAPLPLPATGGDQSGLPLGAQPTAEGVVETTPGGEATGGANG